MSGFWFFRRFQSSTVISDMAFFRTAFDRNSRSRRSLAGCSSAVAVDALEPRLLLTVVNLSDEEQLVLELINRARANPTAEASRYGITLNENLPAETISANPKQPLAANQLLVNAAVAHSQDMINRDFFAHTNPSGVTPGGRATAAGYDWWTIAENIAWISYFGSPNIASLAQSSHENLFKSAGHRENILRDDIEEAGIGIRNGTFAPAGGEANLTTELFGRRNLNPIITGVVFADLNNSDFYDIGEAVRSGDVTATRLSDQAVFSATIGLSGGFGIIVPAGQYSVRAAFTSGGSPATLSTTVTVDTENVKVDFDTTTIEPFSISLSSSIATLREFGVGSSAQFTVTRTGSTAQPLTVSLSSNDLTEATVPATVEIPAGAESVGLTVSAVDDGVIDGNRNAAITVSAVGAESANRSIQVTDSTAPTFAVSQIVSTVARPEFTWTSVSNAATYEIILTNLVSGAGGGFRQAGIASTSFLSPIDLPLGTYNVRVRGFTESGAAGVWSTSQIARVRPTTTILNTGRTETTGTFTIQWTQIPGATSYDLLVERMTGTTIVQLRNTSVPDPSFAVTNLPIGRYRVRVRGQNLRGDVTNWSDPGTIYVSLVTTGIGVSAANLSSQGSLNWNAVRGAVRYDVRVDNRTTGVAQFIRNVNVIGTSLAMPTLTAGWYRAWVRPVDAANVVYVTGASFDFVFAGAPRLSVVASASPSRPILQWTGVSGATRYELVIANAALTPLITESNLTGTQFQPVADLAAGSYRAWIRAFDGNGNSSAQSTTIVFTVAGLETNSFGNAQAGLIDAVFAVFDSLLEDEDLPVSIADSYQPVKTVPEEASRTFVDWAPVPFTPTAEALTNGETAMAVEISDGTQNVLIRRADLANFYETLPLSVSCRLTLSSKWRSNT